MQSLGELQWAHEWEVSLDPTGENPALQLRCSICRALVEVLMLEARDELFLRTQLVEEGAHPVSQEELDFVGKAVYRQFVAPGLRQ